MKSRRSNRFNKLYRALPKEARTQAREAYHIFKQNPYHPSLNFERIDPRDPNVRPEDDP